MLGWLLNLGFAGGNDGAASPPVTTFTQIKILRDQHDSAIIIGDTIGRVGISAVQLVRPEFPYTFPIDFNEFEAGRTYNGGKVKLLHG